jgi:hypothetical protein
MVKYLILQKEKPLEFTLGQGKLIAGFGVNRYENKREKRLPFQKRLMANLVKI